MTRRKHVLRLYLCTLGIFILLLVLPTAGKAFHDQEPAGRGKIDLRGFMLLGGGLIKNPADNILFPQKTETSWALNLRVLLDAPLTEDIKLKLNVLQAARSTAAAALSRLSATPPPLDVERSSLSARRQTNNEHRQALLAADALYVQISTDRMDISLGRQPINLATTFYFTPNDFFAPFAAQTFYRLYKPGVDAARADIRLGNLSLFSLIGVFGYDLDSSTDTGWSRRPVRDRSSALARISWSDAGFEWALLGGIVREYFICGGSTQGEIADWLGVRAEGHYASATKNHDSGYAELTVGLEHRFLNSVTVRIEQFHHGRGFDTIEKTNAVIQNDRTIGGGYLGKSYTALALEYEFSPLLFGQLLTLANWTDHSSLIAGNAVYSISDESELAAGISLPLGDSPDNLQITSEFGMQPKTISLEYRLFF